MSDEVKSLIEALGGRQEIGARLGVIRQNIDHWLRKNELPGHLYFTFCELAGEKGVELDPGLFHFERKPRRRKVESNAEATQDGE